MKKILVIACSALLLYSCGQSLNKKAERLVENAVKTSLVLPKSYDPIETQVDSAYSPMLSPELMTTCTKIFENMRTIESYDREINSARSSMAIWNDRSSAFSREEYQQAQDKFNKYDELRTGLVNETKDLIFQMQSLYQEEPQFIGYVVYHRYRAQNNLGNTLVGETAVLVSPDAKEILYEYDTDALSSIADGDTQRKLLHFAEQIMTEEM